LNELKRLIRAFAFINDEAVVAPRDKEQFSHNLWKNLSFVGVDVENRSVPFFLFIIL
jgi:hypothetical protein